MVTCSGRWQWCPIFAEYLNPFVYNFAKLRENRLFVLAMATTSEHQAREISNVALVFLRPRYDFGVTGAVFHLLDSSFAPPACDDRGLDSRLRGNDGLSAKLQPPMESCQR